jgi:predicted ABC-type ATPase
VTSQKKNQVVIVAGANGSGKTTFAKKFLDVTKYEFLNADEIAKEINPLDPSKARIEAGRKVISLIDFYIKAKKNFVIESTLAGSFLEKHIANLKKNNYEVNLTYIFLGSETLCINRIKSRVRQGGHDVPEEDVIRRFKRGLLKFWDLYRLQVDLYSIYFNNEFYDFKQVAQGKNDNVEILLQPLFDDFIQIIEDTKNG